MPPRSESNPPREYSPESHTEVGIAQLITATADSIEAVAQQYIIIKGGPRQASQAFERARLPHASPGTQARAVQLALAHVMLNHAHQSGALQRLVQLRGIIRTLYDDDMEKVGTFLVTYPAAAACIAHWAATDETKLQLALKCYSELLTTLA